MADEHIGNKLASLMHLLTELETEDAAKKKETAWSKRDVDIERQGKKIILPNDPAPMSIRSAISALERKEKDENQMMTIHEEFEAHPLEALVAFNLAMRNLYGWALAIPTPGFFGPRPPDMLSIQTDLHTWVQVPYGSFKIPGIENPIQTTTTRHRKFGRILVIHGEARKKEQHVLMELAAETRKILLTHSIYRGRALQLEVADNGELDLSNPPKFMDVRRAKLDDLILTNKVYRQVEVNIFGPILHTDDVRAADIPLKRGVLLSGPFGVGKTMTARITAKLCIDNGWTFIMVDRGTALTEALKFAQRYQPAVVFCEDIDRTVNKRSDGANDLLNTISGIVANDAEVMVVLTTNYVEKIEQAMLRPGRLDAVIGITPPDAEAVERLVRLYAKGKLAPDQDLTEVGEELAGNIPAVVMEVVARSKLAMIVAGEKAITADNLLVTAEGMEAHRKLLLPKEEEPSDFEKLGMLMASVIGGKPDYPIAEQRFSEEMLVKINAIIDHLDIG